jgi:hypothetical protein
MLKAAFRSAGKLNNSGSVFVKWVIVSAWTLWLMIYRKPTLNRAEWSCSSNAGLASEPLAFDKSKIGINLDFQDHTQSCILRSVVAY